MRIFKIIKKIAAPAITVAVATYILKAPSGIYFPPFENADFSDVYLNAEEAAASMIPEKIHQVISVISDFLQRVTNN